MFLIFEKSTSSLLQIASAFFAIGGMRAPFSNCKHSTTLLHSCIQLAKTNDLKTKKLSFQQYNYELSKYIQDEYSDLYQKLRIRYIHSLFCK